MQSLGGGTVVAQATGIPGVSLAGDASGSTSGRCSPQKNIHLESGTQVVLGVRLWRTSNYEELLDNEL